MACFPLIPSAALRPSSNLPPARGKGKVSSPLEGEDQGRYKPGTLVTHRPGTWVILSETVAEPPWREVNALEKDGP